MKNFRLKTILIFSLVCTGLLVYSLIQNSHQIDFAATKNLHYQGCMIQEINKCNDIDSVKILAIQHIERFGKSNQNDSNREIKVSGILIGIIILILSIIILVINEIKNKRKTFLRLKNFNDYTQNKQQTNPGRRRYFSNESRSTNGNSNSKYVLAR